MPTLEERVQALEQEITARKRAEETLIQENAARKHSEEMLTIAVRALVSKEAFETLQETIKENQEQNGKLFNVIINQNAFHNERLGDLQNQIIELDGKTAGLQTEMRQRFTEQDGKITELDGKVTGLQTEMRQRFTEQDGKITGLQTEMRQQFTEVRTDIAEHTTLLTEILARLPEKPS